MLIDVNGDLATTVAVVVSGHRSRVDVADISDSLSKYEAVTGKEAVGVCDQINAYKTCFARILADVDLIELSDFSPCVTEVVSAVLVIAELERI